MNFHASSIAQVLVEFQSSKYGLNSAEVEIRLKKNGLNILSSSEKEIKKIKIFLSQWKSPLVIVLVLAGIISGFLGEYTDMVVIFLTSFINSLIGFFQENKANDALKKLKEMIEYKAIVLRDKKKQQIASENIVPGDILFIEAGEKVQADGRLVEVNDLEINESALTGEYLPVKKNIKKLSEDASLADRKNMVFRGTVVVNGKGIVVVTATASNTEIGKIANLVKQTKEEDTPLQKQLAILSRFIGIVVLIICIFIFFVGIFLSKEHSFLELFETAVAVAVAAIPEGLIISLTVILAVGMRYILKRKALVRKLLAAETLGSVSVICTDKTGSVTEGKMKVIKLITVSNDFEMEELGILNKEKEDKYPLAILAIKIGVLCNDAIIQNADKEIENWQVLGDSTEVALTQAGISAGINKYYLDSAFERIGEVTFSSERKYMATLHKVGPQEYLIYVKGAPEVVLDRCQFLENINGSKKITEKEKLFFINRIEELSKLGLRVLALAYKKQNKPELKEKNINNLVFVGILGLADPVRPDVKNTLAVAKQAGIRTILITGDHVRTAQSIGGLIGLEDVDNIFDGKKLEIIGNEELRNVVTNTSIFARVNPEHKIRIVRALQENGEVVAMTGDGVNDAPALKAADIGVALGSGTDVAKETADLVLLDDSYKTIVAAVEEGRRIYQNTRKFVLFLLAGSFSEVVLVAGSLVLGIPLSILPTQILWMNIIHESLPAMALAFDRGEKRNMFDPPRSKQEKIVNTSMLSIIIAISVISNIGLFYLFIHYYYLTNNLDLARTVSFVGLGVMSIFYIFPIRSLRTSFLKINPFSNYYLDLAILFTISMIVASVYYPPLQKILKTVPLSFKQWIVIIGFSVFNMFLIEFVKLIFIKLKK